MKQQKGRAAPARIDHMAVLQNRLGAAAAAAFNPDVQWKTYAEVQREQYREVGMAVYAALVKVGSRRGNLEVGSILSAQDGAPYVDLWASVSPMQISPGKAREIALLRAQRERRRGKAVGSV